MEFDDNVSPILKLKSKNSNEDCNREILVKYYAFSENLFNCNEKNTSEANEKNEIILEIIDLETEEDITDEYQVTISYPEGKECESGCDTLSSGECLCEELSIFEPGAQFEAIFSNSNLGLATDFSAFANWKFYESIGFWFVVANIIGFGVTALVVTKIIPKYCIMDKFRASKT